MNPLRVGVIGVGHLGYHHARIYTELLETKLVGVMDIDRKGLLPWERLFKCHIMVI